MNGWFRWPSYGRSKKVFSAYGATRSVKINNIHQLYQRGASVGLLTLALLSAANNAG